MKFVIPFFLAVAVLSCKSDQDIRSMIREEIAQASAKTYYPSQDVIGPYSPAVKAGPMLFVSGQIGLDPQTGQFPGEDIESQTRQTLTNLMAVLTRAGFDSSDVVQCTVFLKDIRDFQKMNLIYGGYFAENQYPTRSTVEASNLPRNAKIEISAIAWKAQ